MTCIVTVVLHYFRNCCYIRVKEVSLTSSPTPPTVDCPNVNATVAAAVAAAVAAITPEDGITQADVDDAVAVAKALKDKMKKKENKINAAALVNPCWCWRGGQRGVCNCQNAESEHSNGNLGSAE